MAPPVSAIRLAGSVLLLLLLAPLFVLPSPTLAVTAPERATAAAARGRSSACLADLKVRATRQAKASAVRAPRVRPATAAAGRLIADGIRRSYTIARLVDIIERGDLVVYVHLGSPQDGLRTSQTRLMSSGASRWRYASVWIDNKLLLPLQRLEMLGHELQHVAEIAEARTVTDDDSLQRLYERIGRSSYHERAFETTAAIVVQMRVAQELLVRVDTNEARHDGRSPAGDSAAEPRRLYDAYCAVCHGHNGKGHGRASDVLTTTPPDLTLLAYRNGGAFPRASVERCIRVSTRRPSANAGSEMPVWTEPLLVGTDAGAAAHAETIAAYVESLQRQFR